MTSTDKHTPNGIGTAPGRTAPAARAEANARLTGSLGLILLVLMIAEVITDILGVQNILTLHATIGFVAAPLALLKMASTGWRMVRYYSGDPDYRERGAPTPYLRVLGPLLVILTVTLFTSGIAAYIGPPWMEPTALMTHKVSFYLWLLTLVGHTVPHFAEALHLAYTDLSRRTRHLVPGLMARRTAILASIGIGTLVAVILSGHAASFLMQHPFTKHR